MSWNDKERLAHEEFLAGLKVGDQVALYVSGSRFSRRSYYISKIERLTPKQAIVIGPYGKELRFHRNSGREVGNHYGTELVAVTDNILRYVAESRAYERFNTLIIHGVKNLTHDDRVALLAAYDALHPEE